MSDSSHADPSASNPPRDDLSVVVLTQDSSATIESTLRAANQLSRDVHVVDSGSRDETVRIAEDLGARVQHRPFSSYHDQRNWAIHNLPLHGAWELHLDDSEELSAALVSEILELDLESVEADAFLIPRLEVFLGQEIRHGGRWPSWQLRLFRRGAARVEARPYDQHFVISGTVARLDSALIDRVAVSLGEWKARHRRWARLEAESRRSAGEELQAAWDGDPRQRRRAWRRLYYRFPPLIRPFLWFFIRAVVQRGFLDGPIGLHYHYLHTIWYRGLVDLELLSQGWRSLRGNREEAGSP